MGLFDDLTPGNAGSFADLIPKPKPRGLLGLANDTVISAANQIAGGVGSIANAVVPGNRLSQFIDEDIVKAGEDKQSDIVKQSRARFQAEMEAAQGGWDEAAAVGRYVADNPMQTLAQAAGALALVGLPMSGIGKFVTGLRTGMGATEAAAAATAAKVSSGAGAALGGLMSGGDAAGTAYELVQKTPLDTLMLSPQAQELSSAGLDEKAIRDELGTRAARAAMPIPTLIGAGSGLIGAERILAGGKPLAGGALARGAQTALVEGAGEFADEAATQYFGQKGAAEYNPTIDPTKGVVGAGLLGMALGAPTGGVVGALSKGRDPLAEAVPPGAPDPVAKVLNAGSIDEAIQEATAATSGPLAPIPPMGAAGEAAAMAGFEAQAKADFDAIKQTGRMDRTGLPPLPPRPPGPQPTAEAIDSPFGDRVLTLREQLADERVREQLRANFGEDALDDAAYYSSIADRTDINLPERTRERMLSLAEAMVSRSIAQPMARAGVPSSAAPARPQVGANAAPLAIPLDMTPTGRMRADASGNVVPETRADVISAADDKRNRAAGRGQGMTGSFPQGAPNRPGVTVGEGTLTPGARPERAAAAAGPTLLLTADGFPYGSRVGAQARANKEGGEVVRVEGGFAVRPAEVAPVAPAPVAPPVAAEQRLASAEQTPAAAPVAPRVGGFTPAPNGYKVRVSQHEKGSNALDPTADVGAFIYEVRKGDNDRNPLTMVVNKDGKLVPAGAVLTNNESNGTAWVPKSQAAADAVQSLLEQRAGTEVGSAARKAIDAKIAEAVAADQAGPTGGATAPTLTEGQRVTLAGQSYTVTTANGSAVRLQGADGGIKMVARNSKTFGQIQAATGNPMLDNPASWVIREKATGKVVMETFDKDKVNALNTAKYEAVPAAKYLGDLNKATKNDAQPTPATQRTQAPAPPAATQAEPAAAAARPADLEADGVSPLATAKVGDTVDVVHRDSNGALRVAGTVLSIEDKGVWIKESDGRRLVNRSDFGNWIKAGDQEKKTDNYATWTAYEGAAPAYVTVIGERDGEVEIDDGYTTQWVPKSQVEQAGKSAADAFESEKLNLTRIKEISDRQGMGLDTDHMRSPGLAATGWSAHAGGSKPASEPPAAPAAPQATESAQAANLPLPLPRRLEALSGSERDIYEFDKRLEGARKPLDVKVSDDADPIDGTAMTPERLVRQRDTAAASARDQDGKLRSKNSTGATVGGLLDAWTMAAQAEAAIQKSRRESPELWAGYDARQAQVAALDVGAQVLTPYPSPEHPRGAPGKIARKFPRNWRIEYADGNTVLVEPTALRPAEAPAAAPAAPTATKPKAPKAAATPADPAAPQLLRKATNPERMSPRLKQVALNKFPEQEGTENVFMPYGPDGAGFYRVPKGWKAEAPVEAASPAPAPVAESTSEEQRTQASSHAKDLGGRVVWQRGDLALIEGYSLLSGDSVYVAAKGDSRTRVDIEKYTGSGYTDAEKAELLKARADAVRAADEALARNPDGPFGSESLVFADDIPASVRGVVRGWIGLLGLDGARIVVTTPASGATMADGLAGKFRRIGKASLRGENTNGTMQPLGGDDFHIAVRRGVSTLKALEVLAHELGHIVERRAFADAPADTQQAIREAHAQWLKANGNGRALDMAQAMRAYRSGRTTGFGADAAAQDAGAYWRSFGEWFADQVSRWATTQDRPVGVVEQFFKRLADRLRRFFTGERSKFLPDTTVSQWLDSLSKEIPPTDVVEPAAEPAPPPAAEKAPQAEATHKDPGEPAEPVTAEVVKDAIATAAESRDRPRSAIKADALRLIDEAIAKAPAKGEKKITIRIPGDGVFSIVNNVDRLKEFRRQVELSPGFKDKQPRPAIGKANESANYGPDQLAREMLEDGEPLNAIETLEAAGKTMMFGNANGDRPIPYTNGEPVEIAGIGDLFVGRGWSTKKGSTSWWSVIHKPSGFALGGSAGNKSEAIAEAKKLLAQPEKRAKMEEIVASGKSADGKPFKSQDELRAEFIEWAEKHQQATFAAADATVARAKAMREKEAELDAFYESIMGDGLKRPARTDWTQKSVEELLNAAEKQGKAEEALKFAREVVNSYNEPTVEKWATAYARRTQPTDTGWQTGFQAPGGYRRIRRDVTLTDGTTYRAELDERAGAYVTGLVQKWSTNNGTPKTVQTYSNDMDARRKADGFLDGLTAAAKPAQASPVNAPAPAPDAPVSSREGQMRLANRGSRIAALKLLNEQLRKIAPSEAWNDKNIEAATDLDALQDQISTALVDAQRAPAAVNPLRAELEEMSGAELRAIMARMGLAGARMTQSERIEALLAEDEGAVRAAMTPADAGETPQLTEAQARKQFEWRDMGQSGGTKTHRLFFYLKPEDKGTGRAMGRGYVELYEGSSGWRVDGEGESYKALADAKKAAVEAAIPVLREQGWIAPADTSPTAPEEAKPAEPQEAKAPETAPMPYVPGIPRDVAQRAHAGTSHVPEVRAGQEQASFMGQLADAWARAARAAGTDEAARARITEVFTEVAEGYRARYLRTLEARGRVMSSMIAGPARFPVERNRKRMETERKRSDEAGQFLARGIKRLLRAARGPIDNSPEAELENVRLRLAEREDLQESMKAANAALRKDDDAALEELGFTAEQIADLKKPDFAGRKGFPDYRIANNNAEIRRLRERLASAEERMQDAAAGPVETERPGVRVVEDATDDRLRLFFDGKPSDEVRDALKAAAFKWSPSAGAWQRQLTDNARYAAKRVLDKHFPANDAGADISVDPSPLSRAPSVNLALEASDAVGREFWRKIDNGESFTDQEVLDALSINRRGSRRTARGVAGTSGQASVGESVVRWADPIAGFDGYTTVAARDGDAFSLYAIPNELADGADLTDPAQARDRAIATYALTPAPDGRHEFSINDTPTGSAIQALLMQRGALEEAGRPDRLYTRVNIGYTANRALTQEALRRLALNIGATPTVFYPARDTGARAGQPDTARNFTADDVRDNFSRGPGLRGKVSVRDARAMADELRTAFPRAPQIRILEKVNQAPRALLEDIRAAGAELDVEAAFHKGEIYVFPGNIDSIERLRHVMTKHEIRHAGFRGLLGEGMDRTMLALYEANATVRKAADAKLAARLAGSKAEAVDEALADMTPEDIAAMTGARPLLAKLRLALRRLAGRLRAMGWTTVADAITPSGWSDADVVALVLKAESMALRGQTDGTRFSRAPAVLSEAFRRWFGDSKVVDADGKPLVVYHGTRGDVAQFEPASVGARFPKQSAGFYFSSRPETASLYADSLNNAAEGFNPKSKFIKPVADGANVMPAYVALKNPLILTTQDFSAERMLDADGGKIVRDAKAKGYDGVIVRRNVGDEFDGTTVVAFRPEQIKSATGNAGTYDRTNPDIRYSRRSVAAAMADTINSVREVSLPAGYKVADLLDSHGKITAWDKTVGTPFNLAKRHPGTFGKVYDRVQQFLNDISHHATEAADLAPSILPKLESLKDITKSPLSAADTKAIAAPIFEGTLTWTRDRMGKPISMEVAESRAEAMTVDEKASELLQAARIDPKVLRMWQGMPIDQYEAAVTTRYANEMLRPGVVWTDAELKSMFKLGDAQIKLYRQFRASIDRSLDDLTKSEMIRMGGKDVAGMADALQAMSVTEARNAIADRLREVAETDDGRAKALDKAAQAVADLGTKAADLKARGYAPLTRFGSYTLDVVDNGERVYFGMFESQYEANRMQRKMREQFPRATIQQGTQDTEAFKMFAGISPETIELFGEILGLDSTGDEASDKAFQTFLQKARSTRSAMKRLIHRKGIDGFSEDAGRVLAGFLTSNARRTSSNMHLKGILDAVEQIPKQQGELKTYAAKMVDYVQNPVEEAAALRGVLFAQYLGGSVASALVNMSQPIMVSVPYLSQYGGAKQAAAAMVRAMKDMASGAKLEPALAKALKAAEEDGIVAPQEIHQLQAQARGQAALRSGDGTKAGDAAAIASNTLSRASLAWGKLFGFAELVNRRSTYIAAYRVGRAEGMADPDAFARQAVVETQFTYNRGNRPQWARGAIAATLFTFKTYSVSYVELLSRMAKSGPEGRRAALLAAALLLLMSGADGLPFMEDAEDVLDAFMQRIMGRNWSTKQKRNELLAEILGKDAGQFLQNGISGLPGVPIDVSGRMGMGNLIPGTGLLRKDSQPGRDMKELLGPVADLAERTGRAAGMVLQGDVGRAALEVSPVAARNVAKGADMIETGTYRDAKGRKVIDTTATEAIAKMAGFQPATVARVQEATNTVQRAIALNKTVEAEIADQWAQGLYEKDADKVAAARERLRDWNAANEDMPIKITFQQVRKRLQAMNQDKATRMEKTAPKEIRREIRRELAEAGR